MATQKNKIYIYNGPGVSAESFSHSSLMISSIYQDNIDITALGVEDLLVSSWTDDAALFIMPGGRDLPYVKRLKGAGNSIIKKFIYEGGSYLGICAGAYYGSSYVEFDKDGALEVTGDRELAFFPGKAIGPLLAPFDYYSSSGVRAASIIKTCCQDTLPIHLFFNGGSYFEGANLHSTVEVLATYGDVPGNFAAIVEIGVGLGKAMLSGVHFEYDPYLLSKEEEAIQMALPKLLESNTSRLSFCKTLLSRLIS